MSKQAQVGRRRTAPEWRRLIAAWKRSGLSARRFAASAQVAPRTLVWWQWRLSKPPAVQKADEDEVRLVHVDVEPAVSDHASGAMWELSAPSGCTLRVLRRLDGDDVRAIVEAFVSTAVRS